MNHNINRGSKYQLEVTCSGFSFIGNQDHDRLAGLSTQIFLTQNFQLLWFPLISTFLSSTLGKLPEDLADISTPSWRWFEVLEDSLWKFEIRISSIFKAKLHASTCKNTHLSLGRPKSSPLLLFFLWKLRVNYNYCLLFR